MVCAPLSFAQEKFRIGAILPLSGTSARMGQFFQEGFELAKATSTLKLPIEVIYEDDACIPVKGTAAAHKLVTQDKVDLVFGPWCSSVILAVAPILNNRKVIDLNAGLSPKISAAGEYIYRIQVDSSHFIQRLIPFIAEERKVRRIAIYSIINDYGDDTSELFKAFAVKHGLHITAHETYLPETSEFRTQLTKLKSSNPEGIFIVGYAEMGVILRQLRDIGFTKEVFSMPAFENPDIIDTAQGAAEGVFFPNHFDPQSQSPAVIEFQRMYRKKFGQDAESRAAMAFEAFRIFEELLKTCGKNSACQRTLLDSKEFKGIKGMLRFDPNGDVVRPTFIRQYKDGAFRTLE